MKAELTTSADVDVTQLGPDARALQRDLQGAAFAFGADAGWWREVAWSFPTVDIAVAAAERAGAPSEFLFRFEATGYPQQALLCRLWDPDADAPLPINRKPKGIGRVAIVFRNNWKEGRFLYWPLDRHALQTHSDWPGTYRSAWKSTDTIATYLNELYALLNSSAYTGVAGS